MFKKSFAIAALAFAAATASAAPVSVNFATYTNGSAVTEVEGMAFRLLGGPGPTTAPTVGYGGYLTNSVYAGGYPTANILSVVFDGKANEIDFNFYAAGYLSGGGRGDTYYSAFDTSGKLLETGLLGAVTGGERGWFSVAASNVHELQFNNGTNGTDSWWFGLAQLSADVTSNDVPEPASLALLGLGLVGAAVARRRKNA